MNFTISPMFGAMRIFPTLKAFSYLATSCYKFQYLPIGTERNSKYIRNSSEPHHPDREPINACLEAVASKLPP